MRRAAASASSEAKRSLLNNLQPQADGTRSALSIVRIDLIRKGVERCCAWNFATLQTE